MAATQTAAPYVPAAGTWALDPTHPTCRSRPAT